MWANSRSPTVDAAPRGGYIARLPLLRACRDADGLLAQVAELVDAQVSGTCGRKVVKVRVFSWAPASNGQYAIHAERDHPPVSA